MGYHDMRLSSMICSLFSHNGILSYSSLLIIVVFTLSHAIPVGKVDSRNTTTSFGNETLNLKDCIDERGGGVFRSGELVPRFGPCEECRCTDGTVVCSMMQCEIKPGCQTIQRPNQCCPEFKCECEHNGKVYNNGEKLNSTLTPCQVCYCRGGALMCTHFTCFTRDDCQGRTLPGTCCPNYDHCPPLDLSRKGDDPIRNTKREMQPWFMTSPIPPSSTISAVEVNTTSVNEHEPTDLTSLNTEVNEDTNTTHGEESTVDSYDEDNTTHVDEMGTDTTTDLTEVATEYREIDVDDANTTIEPASDMNSTDTTETVVDSTDNTGMVEPEDGVDDYNETSTNGSDTNETDDNTSTQVHETSTGNMSDIQSELMENFTDTITEEQKELEENHFGDYETTTHQSDEGSTEIVAELSSRFEDERNPTSEERELIGSTHDPSYNEDQTNIGDEDFFSSNEQDTTRENGISALNLINTDDMTNSSTTHIPAFSNQDESDGIESDNSEPPTSAIETKNIPSNETTDFIIERLTNITSHYLKNSGFNPNTKDMESDDIGTDIIIQSNRKLESTEEILILERTVNSEGEPDDQAQNEREITETTKYERNNSKKQGHIMRIDFNNVTLPPDIQEEILKLSRILLEKPGQAIVSSVSDRLPSKETWSAFKNVEKVTNNSEKKENLSVTDGDVLEKRNTTSDTNATKSNREESEESKNSDSTGTGLDAQTQQDLLSSSSDAGKNSEYKVQHFEQIESEPISTFTDSVENENSTNNSDDNIQTESQTSISLLDGSGDGVPNNISKEALKLEESSTDDITSTTEARFVGESTTFQSEQTTIEDGITTTTEYYGDQSTMIMETTTDYMTSTQTEFDGTTTSTDSYTETTTKPGPEPTQPPTMPGNEWKLEIVTNQTNNEENNDDGIVIKESPKSKGPSVRDTSSSEESASKDDQSGESGNFNNQEIPGLLLNDQFPYLQLGGFQISTETKTKNRTNTENLKVPKGTDKNELNNKQIIKQLIKDNQHLIIVNQETSSKESTEEETIDKFATELAKILNQEPFEHKELTTKDNFESTNDANFEYLNENRLQHVEARDLDPVSTGTVDEDNSVNLMNEVTTNSNSPMTHGEIHSKESEGVQSNEDCLECSELSVDSEKRRTHRGSVKPIKLIEYDADKYFDKDPGFRNFRVNSKQTKFLRIDGSNKELKNKTGSDHNRGKPSTEYENVPKQDGIDILEQTTLEELNEEQNNGSVYEHIENEDYIVEKENMEGFTLESPQSLFEIKAERIDEKAEGKLFYDSEKFKKPPEIVYPEEYPEEFIYINSPPLLIITSTVYTSVPDVMFVTTQTTNLGLSYDYLTEEYKGDKMEKKMSEAKQKNLKSDDVENREDTEKSNVTFTKEENDGSQKSSKIKNFKDLLRNATSLTNETAENDEYLNKSGKNSTTKSELNTIFALKNNTNHSNSVMKIPRKRKRENQKLLRNMELPHETERIPLRTHSEGLTNPIRRTDARQLNAEAVEEEKDAEWIIPVRPTKGFHLIDDKMATEDADAEWIVPQDKRPDRPQGRQVPVWMDDSVGRQGPVVEEKDAEWIIPQVKTTEGVNRRTTTENNDAEWILPQSPQNTKNGRKLPQENQDAEWITPHPQRTDSRHGRILPEDSKTGRKTPQNQDAEWITPVPQGKNSRHGQILPKDSKTGRETPQNQDAEWITPVPQGSRRHGGSPNNGRLIPVLETDAEWITTTRNTKS
ncbi:hypothetical protein M8J76_010954 [Diaphorina citri]|nr:hypothetical protein M8J75_009423 [Diaphorina citri]KAI5716708.1 hypothetical protein M8J76_010954 [Diaphorina citri]